MMQTIRSCVDGIARTWIGIAVAMALLLSLPGFAATPPPVLGAMANTTYPGLMENPVTLHDGVWEGVPYVTGGASRPRVILVPGFRIAGDLDDDGIPEAVVLLAVSLGGSGTFSYLAAVSHADDGLVVRAVALLGDRVQVRYARIDSGQLLIDTVEAGEDDAACCPGEKRLRRWQLVGEVLEELSAEMLGRLGLEDLGGGITWRLTHLDRDDRVRAVKSPTLVYEDGRLTGFAGCNRYFSAITASAGPGEVKLGPVGSTQMACEPDAMKLETIYLQRLGEVGKFSFIGSQLALTYLHNEQIGTLLFVAK